MPAGPFGEIAKGVARLYGEGTLTGLSEAQLLDRFLARDDPSAFEALVARHGPTVLAVCRRVLRDPHQADDAFQATFLLLVRKAGSVRDADLLGPWLHRVAYRVAIRAGQAEAKRRTRETASSQTLELAAAPESPNRDLGLALHEALEGLPEKYRAPIVLCDLEGRTHEEAAKSLKWPIGSVKGRLSRGRELLKTRLTRRGITGAVAALLAEEASAAVPVSLQVLTAKAATLFAAQHSGAIAAGTVSATAALLAEEAARAMTIKKLTALAASAAAMFLMAGAAVLARQDGAKPAEAPKAVQDTAGGPSGQAKTGLQVAEELEEQLAVQQHNRDFRASQIASLQADLDQSRAFILKIEELLRNMEFEEILNSPDKAIDDREHKNERITRLRDAHSQRQPKIQKTYTFLAKYQKEAETIDRAIRDLNARIDAARDRPGKPNTVQVGDMIRIEALEMLPGRPLMGKRLVRPDGTVSLEYYGDLKVVGLNRDEIKVKLIELLQHFITDEALGLVGQDTATGEVIVVTPAQSGRVFVDDTQYPDDIDPSRLESLERKLDEVLRRMPAPQSSPRGRK